MTFPARHWGRLLSIGLALLVVSLGTGCQTTGSTEHSKGDHGATPATMDVIYRFQPGDLVSIVFSGNSAAPQPFEGRIKDDGTVELLYLGSVQAVGKTEGELQKDIHEQYVPKYFKTLNVTVRAEERFFYVYGEVKQPGRIIYAGSGMTVLKAIAAASGFTDYAKKTKVELTRANKKKSTIDCIKAQIKPDLDLPVYPDDQIYVPRRLFLP